MKCLRCLAEFQISPGDAKYCIVELGNEWLDGFWGLSGY